MQINQGMNFAESTVDGAMIKLLFVGSRVTISAMLSCCANLCIAIFLSHTQATVSDKFY